MQKGLKIDGTIRALVIALGAAVLTSVIAMFIPVSAFESITGATGFSELVPATGAPLGDTARAIIAFGFGALTFAALAMFLLRRPSVATAAEVSEGSSFIAKMRAKFTSLTTRSNYADAVTELSDLPKLRAGDAHPDAPPRRPISAHRDFGEVVAEPAVEESVIVPIEDGAETPVVERVADLATGTISDPATVTNMVDRLELAVAQRQDQIAKLEALASAEIAKPELVAPAAVAETEPAIVMEPQRQTILEAVPSEPATELVEDDMDAALRSALQTLHRMNARPR